jgi:hypothetical protein
MATSSSPSVARTASRSFAAREHETRRERVPDASAPLPRPRRAEALALAQARARLFAKRVRHAIARVHHRLAADGANAARKARLHHGVVVVDGPHVEDRRGAGEEHLGQPELGARRERGLVVRGFERPDAPP